MDPGDYYDQLLNRNLGVYYTSSFPFSRYSRFEGSINFNRFIRQTIRTNYWGNEASVSYDSENLFSPYVKYVWDNTRWFFIYPVSGSRIYIKYDFAPSTTFNDYSYKMLTFDSRSYIEISFKNKVSIAASQSAILPRSIIGTTEIPLSLNINIPRAINWSDVFNFAILDTGTLTFISAKYSLKPETAISRSNIIRAGIVSQSAITSFEVRIKITAAISSLSAIGSRKVPKLETSFLILAKYPSK